MNLKPPELSANRILRHKKRLAFAGGLVAIIGLTLVFPFPMSGRMWGDIFDLAHAPTFCFALIAMAGFFDPPSIGLPQRFSTIIPMTLQRIVGVATALAMVGLVGEYLQKFANRSPSWGDVAANTAGLVAGFCWVAGCQVRPARKLIGGLVTVAILIAVSVNPVLEILDSVAQKQAFPMLASFERSRELGNWSGHRALLEQSTEWSTHSTTSLLARLQPGEYPGVAMLHMEQDWRDFRALQLDVRNGSQETQKIIIKIQDEQHSRTGFDYHDRFHYEFNLEPGQEQNVSISLDDVKAAPSEREMNMAEINMIDIFAVDVKKPFSLFVDQILLSK